MFKLTLGWNWKGWQLLARLKVQTGKLRGPRD